jgi:hypothetical protein
MKKTKTIVSTLAIISACIVGSVIIVEGLGKKAMAGSPSRPSEVVILTGDYDYLPSGGLAIQAYSHSAGAPSMTNGTPLAQAVADLLNYGFRIEHVNDQGLSYTLVK